MKSYSKSHSRKASEKTSLWRIGKPRIHVFRPDLDANEKQDEGIFVIRDKYGKISECQGFLKCMECLVEWSLGQVETLLRRSLG